MRVGAWGRGRVAVGGCRTDGDAAEDVVVPAAAAVAAVDVEVPDNGRAAPAGSAPHSAAAASPTWPRGRAARGGADGAELAG